MEDKSPVWPRSTISATGLNQGSYRMPLLSIMTLAISLTLLSYIAAECLTDTTLAPAFDKTRQRGTWLNNAIIYGAEDSTSLWYGRQDTTAVSLFDLITARSRHHSLTSAFLKTQSHPTTTKCTQVAHISMGEGGSKWDPVGEAQKLTRVGRKGLPQATFGITVGPPLTLKCELANQTSLGRSCNSSWEQVAGELCELRHPTSYAAKLPFVGTLLTPANIGEAPETLWTKEFAYANIQTTNGTMTRKGSLSFHPAVTAALERSVRTRTLSGSSNAARVTELLTTLPNFDGVDQLDRFASDALGVHVNARLLEKYGKGFSGAPVYQMIDVNGQLVAVAKIFPQGLKNNVADELSSLEYLLHHATEKINITPPLAVGSTRLFNEELGKYDLAGVVIYEAAQGTSVAEHIRNVGKARTILERQATFTNLKAGVEKTAGLLASLHGYGTKMKSSEVYLERFFEKVTLRSQEVVRYQPIYAAVGVNVSNLEMRVKELIDQSRREAHRLRSASPVHGDAHPGNFFYDPESQQVTVIDVITLSASLDENGEPCGAPERDLAQFLHMLRRDGARAGMRDDEVLECSHAFMSSYTKSFTSFSRVTVAILGVCSVVSSLLRMTKSVWEQQFSDNLKQQLFILEEMFRLADPRKEGEV